MEMPDQQTLDEIEGFAYKYLTKKEILIILDGSVTREQLMDEQDPHYKAFVKGRLMRKAEYNGEIIKLSKQLSSPAMALEADLAQRVSIADQRDE